MHTYHTLVALLTTASVAYVVMRISYAAVKRYSAARQRGALSEGLVFSACTFAVLATISIGTIYLVGAACRLDVTQVGTVGRGSVAEAVGFRAGDIITHVNGRPVMHQHNIVESIWSGSEMNLTVVRGRHSLDLILPAALLDAGTIAEDYGFHFPLLKKSLSLKEALHHWTLAVNYFIGGATGAPTQVPPFLVGIRYVDTLAFFLAVFSFLLPVGAPLCVFYRRWSMGSAAKTAKQRLLAQAPVHRSRHRWTLAGRIVNEPARGAVTLEQLAALLSLVLVMLLALPPLASSINAAYCAMVYGMDGRNPEDGRDNYKTLPTSGTHCWIRTRRTGPSPTTYYF